MKEIKGSLDGSLSQASWNYIARKTRWCPLLYGTPRIVARGKTVALASSRQWFSVAAIGVAVAGAVFVVAIYPHLWWLFPRLPVPWFLSHDLVAAVALGFAAISALGLARANRIEFDGGSIPGQLEILQGLFPFVTRLRARLDELSVRLSVADGKSTFPAGYVVLSLYREDAEGRPIHIAVLEPDPGDVISALEPGRGLGAAYSCLAQRMKADDQTVDRLALPERGEIVAPKTPLRFMSSSFASYRLAFSDADHVVFLPTKSGRRWSLSFFLMGRISKIARAMTTVLRPRTSLNVKARPSFLSVIGMAGAFIATSSAVYQKSLAAVPTLFSDGHTGSPQHSSGYRFARDHRLSERAMAAASFRSRNLHRSDTSMAEPADRRLGRCDRRAQRGVFNWLRWTGF